MEGLIQYAVDAPKAFVCVASRERRLLCKKGSMKHTEWMGRACSIQAELR